MRRERDPRVVDEVADALGEESRADEEEDAG